jgi:hypothetical protein
VRTYGDTAPTPDCSPLPQADVVQLRPLQRAPFGGLNELIDVNDKDRLKAPTRRPREQLGVLATTPRELGHVRERVPTVEAKRRHHLDRHAFVNKHEHAVKFYAAAATSCAKERASAMLADLTLGYNSMISASL